ncbi:hypothetical protein D3C78_780220 [compost metagenome]
MGHRIQPGLIQTRVRNRIGERNRGHKRHGVNEHHPEHQDGLVNVRGITQCSCADEMTNHISAVSAKPFISNNAHQRWHHNRCQPFRAVNHTHVGTGKM